MPCDREEFVAGIPFAEGTIPECSNREGKNAGKSGEKVVQVGKRDKKKVG
jgi:hypothetical protein